LKNSVMDKIKNEAIPFTFNSHQIRTVIKPDQSVWFVAKDVAASLGITWSGATLRNIPSAWRTMLSFNMVTGPKDTLLISEPAVYKLAFRSNKPEADQFTNWVVAEVLPSIRKTGQYNIEVSGIGQIVPPLKSSDLEKYDENGRYLFPNQRTKFSQSFMDRVLAQYNAALTEQSAIPLFLAECCDVQPMHLQKQNKFYNDYLTYCWAKGISFLSQHDFERFIKAHYEGRITLHCHKNFSPKWLWHGVMVLPDLLHKVETQKISRELKLFEMRQAVGNLQKAVEGLDS